MAVVQIFMIQVPRGQKNAGTGAASTCQVNLVGQ